jgi:hypothetical protein
MKTATPKNETEQDVKAAESGRPATQHSERPSKGQHAQSHTKTGTGGQGAGGGKKQKHGN